MPPLYDDIADAYPLSLAGGSVQFDTTGATMQTNEAAWNENWPGIWLKLDLSAYVGQGKLIRIDFDCTGDSNGLEPYLDAWFPADVTFDPTAPDFSLLLVTSDGEEFYGDGTAAPGTKTLTFTIDIDGPGHETDGSGIYYIWTGDWNLAVQGLITVTWSAVAVQDVVDTDPATLIGESSARLNGHVNTTGMTSAFRRFQYGTTTAYGSLTTNINVGGGVDADVFTVATGLTPNTTYHFRQRVEITGPGISGSVVLYGEDQSFTTLTDADAPTVSCDSVDAVTPTGADAHGTVDDGGADTHWWFEWHSFDLSESGASPGGTVSAGSGPTGVDETLTGLTPNTEYLVTIVAENREGVESDNCAWFITRLPDDFGTCPPDGSDDFEGDDCTAPAGWTLTDGYRLQGGSLGAYEWQTDNSATRDGEIIGPGLTPRSGDGWWEIEDGAGVQTYGYQITSDTLAPDNQLFIRIDWDAGTCELVKIVESVETVLDSISNPFATGDEIGLRYDRSDFTIAVYQRVAGVWGAPVMSVTDSTFKSKTTLGGFGANGDTFQAKVTQTSPGGPTDPALGDLFDVSSYGQVAVDLFPPFSCPVGHDKYEWSNHSWAGPYFGGSGDSDYPNPAVDCPNWGLVLTVHAFGRIDCPLGSSVGVDGTYQAAMASYGVTAALPYFYANSSEYNTELSQYESDSFAGFQTWDTDFAHKGIDAIQSSLDTVQAAFAADGAFKQANVGDSGRTSYGVFMPVKVAPGRIGGFSFSYEKCGTARRRKQIWRYL